MARAYIVPNIALLFHASHSGRCQPFGQVNVKIRPSVLRVACGYRCERTSHSVERQDVDLACDDAGEKRGSRELRSCGKEGNGEDAPDEERPNECVTEPYESQCAHMRL